MGNCTRVSFKGLVSPLGKLACGFGNNCTCVPGHCGGCRNGSIGGGANCTRVGGRRARDCAVRGVLTCGHSFKGRRLSLATLCTTSHGGCRHSRTVTDGFVGSSRR